MHILGLL